MKKKNAAALLAAAMAASMLAGCGGAASSEATSAAESKPAESTAASSEAAEADETLTVWAWDPNFNIYALKQAEAIYQKDHPNFKLNIEENVYSDIETKLITAATSEDYSTLPDIFLMQDYSFHKMVANFPGIYTEWSPTSPASTPSWTPADSTGTTSPAASWLTPLWTATTTASPSTTVLPSWPSVPTWSRTPV